MDPLNLHINVWNGKQQFTDINLVLKSFKSVKGGSVK